MRKNHTDLLIKNCILTISIKKVTNFGKIRNYTIKFFQISYRVTYFTNIYLENYLFKFLQTKDAHRYFIVFTYTSISTLLVMSKSVAKGSIRYGEKNKSDNPIMNNNTYSKHFSKLASTAFQSGLDSVIEESGEHDPDDDNEVLMDEEAEYYKTHDINKPLDFGEIYNQITDNKYPHVTNNESLNEGINGQGVIPSLGTDLNDNADQINTYGNPAYQSWANDNDDTNEDDLEEGQIKEVLPGSQQVLPGPQQVLPDTLQVPSPRIPRPSRVTYNIDPRTAANLRMLQPVNTPTEDTMDVEERT